MRIYLRILRMAGFMITLYLFHLVQYGAFSRSMTSIMVVGAILLVFPIVWIGRKIVDIQPSIERLAWIYFLKVYEERELEIRFGGSYLKYRSKTPFPWPGKIKGYYPGG